ncbi:MAG: secretion protein HlyD [Proteobacteria bacterium]|nr:secretion protein HlyD [Pseudomonadota bacterium]
MGSAYIAIQYKRNDDPLTLYGNVDIRQVDLGFRISGRLAKMIPEEGDEVKTGDLLAILDKAPYEAAFAAAKAQLSQAEANLAKLKHGNRPQEIEEARANVREREASFTNAELIFKRESEQIKIGASSQQAYDNALSLKLESEAQLKSAKETLSLAEEGFRAEDIAAGQAAMETAKAQLESAQINLKDTEIYSPSDGVILTRVREPGSIIAPQSIVYTLSLHKPVWIRAYIAEPNLGHIKPGMEALVTTDTYPDSPLKGQIGFISPQAEFTPKTVETPELRTDLVYRLRILVHDPKGQLRQGMPVTVNINTYE